MRNAFMRPHLYRKGALYSADCSKCGQTVYAHEWTSDDPNSERDAMQSGTLRCPDCGGTVDPETFYEATRPHYAARYSANGYLDCTSWHYGTNKRRLLRELRDLYGEG